jgi:hypothetical protein
VVAFGLIGIPFYGYGWSAVVIGIIVLAAVWGCSTARRL